jgi:hypothetical protein
MDDRNLEPTEAVVDNGPARFVGEEGEDTRSSPRKDLIAAVIIGAVAIVAMILALGLPVQDSFLSAPGLLPFLVGASLLAMSVFLAVRAVRQGAVADEENKPAFALSSSETIAVPFLIGTIAIYIVALDLITFDLNLPTPFFVFQFSSYELLSIIMLLVLLKVFWRAAFWKCLAVSAVWVTVLAAVFRYGFQILLPGSA